jgi:hypothetical protein
MKYCEKGISGGEGVKKVKDCEGGMWLRGVKKGMDRGEKKRNGGWKERKRED